MGSGPGQWPDSPFKSRLVAADVRRRSPLNFGARNPPRYLGGYVLYWLLTHPSPETGLRVFHVLWGGIPEKLSWTRCCPRANE